MPPPSDAALAIGLMVLAATCSALVGCGPSALKVNGLVAQGMQDLRVESEPVIRAQRVEAGVEAGRAVHDAGGDQAAAEAAADAMLERWSCAISGHRAFSAAVSAYIDELALARINETDFTLSRGLTFARAALDTYRTVQACLESLGSTALLAVPAFLDLFPPAWR